MSLIDSGPGHTARNLCAARQSNRLF